MTKLTELVDKFVLGSEEIHLKIQNLETSESHINITEFNLDRNIGIGLKDEVIITYQTSSKNISIQINTLNFRLDYICDKDKYSGSKIINGTNYSVELSALELNINHHTVAIILAMSFHSTIKKIVNHDGTIHPMP
jgi:hypothetical protein